VDIASLGYVRLESTEVAEWTTFGVEVLGLMVSSQRGDRVSFRLDDHHERITVSRGAENRLLASGWELRDRRALEQAATELDAAGVPYKWGSDEEAHERSVEQFLALEDPSGNRHELYHSALVTCQTLALHGVSSFVTGDMGLGHVVLPVADAAEALPFYTDVLGFLHRDSMLVAPPGVEPYRMRFLACNPRHHSVALTEGPTPTGLRHLMLHADDILDVGRAYDRASARRTLKTAIGQHSNDLMVSFYVYAPGRFELEFATGGERHDNATWTARELDGFKAWGYDMPQLDNS
jgi:3,4-dihydroxy-9,10-secoandrosta-1,3,5(10)-triene-9,17-dione 4,5-dioxygenase